MGAMLDMAEQIGPNTGLLLDAWHLYTSGGTLADLATLAPAQIVLVHINDAPKGVPVDTLMDNARHLPLETGGIDLAGFMRALARIGYDGPVVTEPFNAPLNALAAQDPEAAARQVSQAMSRLWAISGLAQGGD
jgi:sugar phosphate isomerase/epimerase